MTTPDRTRPPLRIANLLGPQAGMLLRAHASKPDVLDLPPEAIAALPSDRNAVFVLQRAVDGGTQPRPAGWPGGVLWVQLASAGIDEYPAWLMDAPLVTSAQGTTAATIAEFAIAMMLAREKRVPELFARSVSDWPVGDERLTKSLGTLRGKTLGLIGAGAIASALTDLAVPFGMRVVAARRTAAPSAHAGMAVAPLDDVLAAADHLVLAAPLTDDTRRLMNDERFAKLKRGAHLINVARGAIVDEDALLRALERDPQFVATLDVTDPEPLPDGHALYAHPRVRISPHQSYSSPRVMEGVVKLFNENLSHFAAGEAMRNVVDRERGY